MIEIDPAKVVFDRLLKENPGASAAELQQLFLAAAMDDPEIAQAVVEDVQDRMFAFDPARAARIFDLMIDRDPAAQEVLEDFLEEMRPQWSGSRRRNAVLAQHRLRRSSRISSTMPGAAAAFTSLGQGREGSEISQSD